jgi:AdoMet-dependent heme synthase
MIEIGDYQFEFGYFQIDITGRCNLFCKHCRAEDNKQYFDLSISDIKKVIDFGIKAGSDRMTISGGEPFLHPNLYEIMQYFRSKANGEIVITTNGTLMNSEFIKMFNKIGNVRIQISLDGPNALIHDEFRGKKGTFNKAIKALRTVRDAGIVVNIRSTLGPEAINHMEEMVKLSINENVPKLSLGLVIATGNALENSLIFTPELKKSALTEIARLTHKYSGKVEITNEDPLRCHMSNLDEYIGDEDPSDPSVFGGCNAGLIGFYCNPEGIIQPCSLLPVPVLDIKVSKDIHRDYVNSDVIKSLLSKNYEGNCGTCYYKRICGGCRANAFGLTGNLMASDPTCWEKVKQVG